MFFRVKKFTVALLFMLLFAPVVAHANSSEIRMAPLSKAFIEYRDSLNKAKASSLFNVGSQVFRGGVVPSPVDLSHLRKAVYSVPYAANLPEKLDPRPEKVAVKSQSPYGTCWAFSAIGAVEHAYLKKNPAADYLNLSPYHLTLAAYRDKIAFTYYKPNEDVDGVVEDPTWANYAMQSGGVNNKAVTIMVAWKTPIKEEQSPYPVSNVGNERLDIDAANHPSFDIKPALHVQGVKFLYQEALDDPSLPKRRNIPVFKQLISDYGAISSGMFVSDDIGCFSKEYKSYYYKSSDPKKAFATNHAILLVGWDDNFPKENFAGTVKPDKDGAWLVKNSWGTHHDFMDRGYFWMSYYADGSIDGAAFDVEEVNNYNYNYGHDDLGWCRMISLPWAANVFTANQASSGNEKIEAVSFYATDANAQYEVGVYSDIPAKGLLFGKLQTGKIELAGYHTVKLDKPVVVKSGDKFSIVVKMTTPGYEFPTAVECIVEEYSDNAKCNIGESFFSSDGKSWVDGVALPGDIKKANACIRAFTKATAEEPTPIHTPVRRSSGGGCDAGFAGGTLFAIVMVLLLRKAEKR